MPDTRPHYVLFDNSAMNHRFGQDPAIDDAIRAAASKRLASEVSAGAVKVLVNLALLGELASLYFSSPEGARERRFRRKP